MQKGFLKTINITSSVATPDTPQTHVKTVTRGKGDPGYSLTAGADLSYFFYFLSLLRLVQS
jgi:hypothetical protein